MKQQFAFNDGTHPELEVILQRSHSFESLTIQISAVLDFENVKFNTWTNGPSTAMIGVKWVYEEIDINTDAVIYARYMSEELIRANYPWAIRNNREDGKKPPEKRTALQEHKQELKDFMKYEAELTDALAAAHGWHSLLPQHQLCNAR